MEWITTKNTFLEVIRHPMSLNKIGRSRPRLISSPSIFSDHLSDCESPSTATSTRSTVTDGDYKKNFDKPSVPGGNKRIRVAVWNLPYRVSEASVLNLFESHGFNPDKIQIEVTDGIHSIIRGSLAYVVVSQPASMSLFLNLRGQEVEGYKVSIAIPSTEWKFSIHESIGTETGSNNSWHPDAIIFEHGRGEQHARKVFVGGLHPSVDSGKLRSYFSNFGIVKDCGIVRDFAGFSRKFGYCEFWENDALEAVLSVTEHRIDSRIVGVRQYCVRR